MGIRTALTGRQRCSHTSLYAAAEEVAAAVAAQAAADIEHFVFWLNFGYRLTACLLRGYGRDGTQNERPGKVVISARPIPAQ